MSSQNIPDPRFPERSRLSRDASDCGKVMPETEVRELLDMVPCISRDIIDYMMAMYLWRFP